MPTEPVSTIPGDEANAEPETGVSDYACPGEATAPCCFTWAPSGACTRPGCCSRVKRISSVSGGSITAGVLGPEMGQSLSSTRPGAVRLRAARGDADTRARRRDDRRRGHRHRAWCFRDAIRDKVAAAYSEHLFGKATLQDLPTSPAIRDQRDERAVGRALALHEAVHARLPRRA